MISKTWRHAALFIATPLLLTAGYLLFFAKPYYRSETKFVVRGATTAPTVGLTQLLKGDAGTDSAYSVREYLLSKASSYALEDAIHLQDHYRLGDFITRFPRWWRLESATNEELHNYLGERIQINVEPQSGVGTVQIEAFEPEVARQIARLMLDRAETALATLNERSRVEGMRVANFERNRAEERFASAQRAIKTFRERSEVVSPDRRVQIDLQRITDIEQALIKARVKREQVRRLAPATPQLEGLDSEISTLEKERAKANTIMHSGDKPQQMTQFERLGTEMELTKRQLALAEEAYFKASTEVQRKQLFLERLAAPTLADFPAGPRAGLIMINSLLMGLVAWLLYATFQSARNEAKH